MEFIFSRTAEKQFIKLDKNIQKMIIDHLQSFKKDQVLFFNALKWVKNLSPATHRIRIGEYRILCEIKNEECDILKIGHRRDIYQ